MRNAAGLLAACVFLAACGGDGGGGDAPSRSEYAQEANRVCADLEKAGNQLQEPDTVAEIATFAGSAEKEVDAAVKRLDELERPAGEDGEKAKAFVDQVKKDTETQIKPALSELRSAAEANDEKRIVAAAEKVQKVDTKRSDQLASAIGATGCAD
jgi:formate dehydrogenase maturation protein FdhE